MRRTSNRRGKSSQLAIRPRLHIDLLPSRIDVRVLMVLSLHARRLALASPLRSCCCGETAWVLLHVAGGELAAK